MDNHVLVGKTVKEIFLADDREAIKFVLGDDSEIIARCDGDCCSHTWIEDVLAPEVAVGSPVLNVIDLELPEDLRTPTKTENYEEEMQYYGCAIETAKGRFTIAYRNSSNGYYGGNLAWPGESYYGGVHGQNESTEQWKLIEGN